VSAEPLHTRIDQIRQDYFEAGHPRHWAYEEILKLIPTFGADAVINALPPPWKRTFYDWAKDMYDNEIPLDQFIKVGSGFAPDEAVEALRGWFAAHPTPPDDPPTPKHVEQLLIHTPEDLDLAKLDTDTLFELATQRTEPFLATSALGELARRNTYHTRDAAETILRRPIWDRYLTAHAIEVLYERDRNTARELMTSLLDTEDAVLLDAMVDVVLENPDHFTKRKPHEFAKQLAARVAATPPGDDTDRERREQFLKQYGAKES
jgi:hypothetical protein